PLIRNQRMALPCGVSQELFSDNSAYEALCITSIKFMSGDYRHKPRHNSPDTWQCGNNRGKNNAEFVQTYTRHSTIKDGIGDPPERIAKVCKKRVEEWADNHQNRLFKIDT